MMPPPVQLTGSRGTDAWTAKTAGYFGDNSKYWNRVYASDSVKGQVYRNRMAAVLRWADSVAGPNAVAADVGTGAGHLAVALAQRGIAVVAIDASDAMLAQVTQNALRAGVADLVVPIAADAQRLDVTSETCDLVVAVGLLPWVSNPSRALGEIARITKPGGYVILTMDNSRSLARRLDPGWYAAARGVLVRTRRMIWPHAPEAPAGQWPSWTTLRDFERLLRSAGLSPLKFRGVGFGPFTFMGRNLLPTRVGLELDRLLQWLADHNAPLLRGTAVYHLALAVKPSEQAAAAG